MLSTVDQTDVFAPQDQYVIASSSTTQRTDVLARRELQVTAASLPRPKRVPLRIPVGGELIEFTYMNFGGGLPKWGEPVLQSLGERWGVKHGWDSYDARPTNPRLAATLLNILFDLMKDTSCPPQITPLADGGIQAEWHQQGQDFELVVCADDEPTFYYFNEGSGEEEEGRISLDYGRVQGLIARLG